MTTALTILVYCIAGVIAIPVITVLGCFILAILAILITLGIALFIGIMESIFK